MHIKRRGTTGPGRAGKAKGAKGAKSAKGTQFSGLVEKVVGDTEEGARQVRSMLMEELTELAEEVEAGKSSKEEASRAFVGMVIKDRFGPQSKTKGNEQMEDSVGDMVEDDPSFVSRLQAQLKKIAKG